MTIAKREVHHNYFLNQDIFKIAESHEQFHLLNNMKRNRKLKQFLIIFTIPQHVSVFEGSLGN
jgi:hypothetical protein